MEKAGTTAVPGNSQDKKTSRMAALGVLAALVIILQAAVSIPVGAFTITLTMVPIIVGAALYGPKGGAFLGAVFGIVVDIQVITGAAGAASTAMLELNPAGTLITVIVKGVVAGLAAGLVAKSVGRRNLYAGVILAAILAPVCNTGIFILALVTIFRSLAEAWAESSGAVLGITYIMAGLVGINFLIELLVDVVLSPAIVRIIRAVRKS